MIENLKLYSRFRFVDLGIPSVTKACRLGLLIGCGMNFLLVVYLVVRMTIDSWFPALTELRLFLLELFNLMFLILAFCSVAGTTVGLLNYILEYVLEGNSKTD